MKKIDFESNLPLTLQVKEILKERFFPGKTNLNKLPTEMELASEYKVNRMVVQRAMTQLCQEGYLYRRPRLGTFVSQQKKDILKVAFYEFKPSAYFMDEIFSMFEKIYPDVTVEGIKLSLKDEYSEDVAKMISDGNVDVIKISESLFKMFNCSKVFYPLNKYARGHKDNTYSEPWEAFKSLNTCYGFPLGFSPVVMAYNKDIFDKAGVSYPKRDWTWKDFLDTAKQINNSSQYGFLFSSSFNRWPAFILQNNGSWFKRDSSLLNIFSPEAREAIEFLHGLMHKEKVAPVFADPAETPQSLFIRSKVAMTLMSYYGFTRLNEISDFSWDVVDLPRQKSRASLLLVDGFTISKKTRNLNLALKFLNFIQSEQVQKYVSECKTIVPVNKSVAERNRKTTPENYNIFKSILPYSKLLDMPFYSPEKDVMEDEMNLLWHGVQSYEETCGHIKTRLKNKLQKKHNKEVLRVA